ncbi:MAG TPA: hypothetical protein VIL42_10555 [Sphingomicrobium sp.]|jgi:hypothetical protein
MSPDKKLLRRIAAIPAGEKLPVGRFAREFNCSQSVMVDMIGGLVERAQVDAITLRPTAASGHIGKGRTASDVGSELLAEIEQFLKRTGMAASTFSKRATASFSFVSKLRQGQVVRARTAVRVRRYMSEYMAGPTPGAADCEGTDPHAKATVPSPGAVDGQKLYDELVAAAAAAGMGLKRFAQPLWNQDSGWKLEQLRIAKRPQAATIARVRALIAGDPLPPPHNAPSADRDDDGLRRPDSRSNLEAVNRDRAKVAHLRDVNETRHEEHARRLREVTRREAAERAARRGKAHLPSRAIDLTDAVGDALVDQIDTAADRRAREYEEIASPSSLLRRAQRDWPDQCVKVKTLAEELGVTLAEAWRRAIAAGVDCLSECEDVDFGEVGQTSTGAA